MEPDGESNPGVADYLKKKFGFIRSTRGGRILIKGGYRHYLKRQNKDSNRTIWICHTKGFCKGSIKLNSEETLIVSETLHCCVPDFQSLDVEKKIIALKEKVTTDYRPIPLLFNEEMESLRTEEYADKLPTFYNKRDALYRARKVSAGLTNFERCEDVVIPENLSEDFLLFGDNEILIFVTTHCKEWIKNIHTYFLDGTFKKVPNPYIQLYTIHGDIGSNNEYTKVVPCMYALLPNKRQETYHKLFQIIKDNLSNFDPNFFKVDFEIGAINALRAIYPSAAISGCYFHYSQAIYKNGDDMNLTESREGCQYLAKCVALAHLPSTKIHEGWFCVTEEYAGRIPNIKAFNKYMTNQWIKIEMIKVLSSYGQRHRTNNVVESWHRKINGRINTTYNLLYFISQLKAEAKLVDFNILQNELQHDVYRKRNKKYTSMDIKIKSLVDKYLEGTVTLKACIQKLSYLKYD